MKKNILKVLAVLLSITLITLITIELFIIFENKNLCEDSDSTSALIVREKIKNQDGSVGKNTFLLYYVNDMYYNTLTKDSIKSDLTVVNICYKVKDPNKINVIDRENEYILSKVNVILLLVLIITIEKTRKASKLK